MTNDPGEAAVRLRKELRNRLRSGAETVELEAKDLHLLLDEIGRLQQANDRLRRQNRRVRKRLQGADGKAPFAGPEDEGEHAIDFGDAGGEALDEEFGDRRGEDAP